MYKHKTIKLPTQEKPGIFREKTNKNYKLVPFKVIMNKWGSPRYFPPVIKEWKNSVYNYNSINNLHLPIYDFKIHSLIKAYFNLYFHHKFIFHKYISRRLKRKSLNKIFISRAEIKHTNHKAIITVYVYNRERLVLLKKIRKFRNLFLNRKLDLLTKVFQNFLGIFDIRSPLGFLLKFRPKKFYGYLNKKYWRGNKRLFKKIQSIFRTIRRLRLRLNLNQFKFEDAFLYKLSEIISKYYGKKVEFNIVNLRSVAYNTDIFTEILTLKMKKEKSNPLRWINLLLSKVILSPTNNIQERSRVENEVNMDLLPNQYPNLTIHSLINKLYLKDDSEKAFENYGKLHKDNLNKLIYNLYSKIVLKNPMKDFSNSSSLLLNQVYYKNLCNIVFLNLKYKNLGGARLRVKGRLTKRYRADRSVYKLKWKGGLKNIDSAFKGLSSVIFRGYRDSNVEECQLASKRRIGSFGVKSWFSGK